MTPYRFSTRATRRIAVSEVPPSSNRLSCTPTRQVQQFGDDLGQDALVLVARRAPARGCPPQRHLAQWRRRRACRSGSAASAAASGSGRAPGVGQLSAAAGAARARSTAPGRRPGTRRGTRRRFPRRRATTAASRMPGWCAARPMMRDLDLGRLHAEATDLGLGVGAPEPDQVAVGQHPGQVAGAVEPAAGRAERVGQEPLRGQLGPAGSSPAPPATPPKYNSPAPGRHRTQPAVEQVRVDAVMAGPIGGRSGSAPGRRPVGYAVTRWVSVGPYWFSNIGAAGRAAQNRGSRR